MQAIEPTLKRSGALPLSSTRVASMLPLKLPRCTLIVLERTCSGSGREMPGWLCRCTPCTSFMPRRCFQLLLTTYQCCTPTFAGASMSRPAHLAELQNDECVLHP